MKRTAQIPLIKLLLWVCAWLWLTSVQANQLLPTLVNGHGVKRIMVFEAYEMTLRTTKPMRQATQVLADKAPQEVSLRMLHDASVDSLIEAINESIKENHADTVEVKPQLEQLYAALNAAGDVRQGSEAKIVWDGLSTSVFLDRQPLLSVPGTALRNALLIVWLGNNPVDSQLKQQLLGGI